MLIVLEGIDGSGKSTAARALAARLEEAGRSVVLTREPGDSEPGRELKRLLSLPERASSPERELALFCADREIHVAKVVRPALERGEWVVQDRTFYSTAAYQGALGLDVADILRQSRLIAPEPDLVFFLALDPKAALARIAASRDSFSSFERIDYLKQVDAIFRSLAEDEPVFRSLDAALPRDRLVAAMWEALAV